MLVTETFTNPAAGDNLASGKNWAYNSRPVRIKRVGFIGDAPGS